ncbi:MAG: DUF2851 family protein [Flavobacteriales bacterium]|nr:DUF2851 family protein [Flavobacteriales bacterium]MBK6943340.1 DUF2851 family protein [Flavobacteriales bacterium]MBK7240783.1 DUF2851 family protein [Flavobacteriales bacterium]MBK9536130.1 DUF2851 family protein [Flavobacteriales bacterium]MBP9139446.1 DUF2851 family protein [Flavobacteriales bacterium]
MDIRPYPTYKSLESNAERQNQLVADKCALLPTPSEEVGTLLLDPSFPYGEHLLQFLWERRLFDARSLRTTDGHTIEILHPGNIQSNSGPDLANARIRINGQQWVGSVEVHVRASEWDRHGHQHDPAYTNVILHVVHTYDTAVHTVNGQSPPTVELAGRIDKERVLLHLDLMKNREQVPCAEHVHRVDPSRIGPWLDRVLVERLEEKTARVETVYKELNGDPAETFYHMLLNGFGFKVNAEPFAMLAHSLPLKYLLKYRDDPFRTEALLFGQAGLLRTDLIDDHPRGLQAEHRVLSQLHGLTPAPLAAWKFGRMRPSNFPTIRIAQLAALVTRLDGHFGALLEHDDPEPLIDMFDLEASTYWNTHYRFDSESKYEPKRIGRSSAERLVANVLVPYLFAMGKVQGQPHLAERAFNLLEHLSPEKNTITDNWVSLGIPNPNAARSQALIQLKNSYCRQRHCLSCVIGAELLKNP